MAVLETTATRRKIVKELQKNKIGFTARELAESLKIKVQTISATLQQMALSGFVQRGELIEGEGQIWEVTALGIETYGTKSDLEVKPPVETLQAKQKNKPLAEIKSVQMPEKSPLTQNEKTVVETAEAAPIVTESVLAQIVVESVLPEPEETVALKHEMTPDSFQIWQIVDEAGVKFKQLLEQKQAKPIENIEYKIATLESLADILNSKHSATLRQIAADLRG